MMDYDVVLCCLSNGYALESLLFSKGTCKVAILYPKSDNGQGRVETEWESNIRVWDANLHSFMHKIHLGNLYHVTFLNHFSFWLSKFELRNDHNY